MVELTPINCRDTDVKVSDFVRANSHLFIPAGSSTVPSWPPPEKWGLTENVEDSVLDQELSLPDQEFSPYFDMNGAQSYSRRHPSGLGLNFASTGLSEVGQRPDLFSCSQYDMMNAADRNDGDEGESPTETTTQDVLEFDTAPASEPIAEFDFEMKSSLEQANGNGETGPESSISGLAVSVKRGYMDSSPRDAKKQRRIQSLSGRDFPAATPVGSLPARHRTKRRRPLISLLSGSLLKNFVRGHGLGDHKSSHLFSELHQPVKTQEGERSQKLVRKISSASRDRTSSNLRCRRSNDWTKPAGDAVGGVTEALSKLSMTV